MSHSLRMGSLGSQYTGHAALRFNCNNMKNYKRMIPTPRDLSASNRNIPDEDHTKDDLDDGVDVAWPIALKGWRVMHKISSGREGDLYQVASNDTDTASPHLLKVFSVKAMQGEWSRLDALKAEAKAIKRLSAPGIPTYVDSFEAAVPGDHLHCLLMRLDSAPRAARLDSVAALVDDDWRPTEEQAQVIQAQLGAVLAHQRSFCPPYVHGSIGAGTVLIARAPHAARSGHDYDAPGCGVSAWVVGPGWDGGRSAAGGDGGAQPSAETDLGGAAVVLAHLTGSHCRPPGGALGAAPLASRRSPVAAADSASSAGLLPDHSAAALAAATTAASRWSDQGRLARFGADAETVIGKRPAGCRPGARLVGAADGVGAAATDPPAHGDGEAGRAAALELELPSRELTPALVAGVAVLLANLLASLVFWLRLWYLSVFSTIAMESGFVLFLLGVTALLAWAAAAAVRSVLGRATLAVTDRALVLTRRIGWVRSARELKVERRDAGAVRLIKAARSESWRVELEHGALPAVQVRARAPMARAEAEWVLALLVACWPELGERVVEVEETDGRRYSR